MSIDFGASAVIHFLTVHWNSDFWIEPQLRQIKSFTDGEYRIYSFFSGLKVPKYESKFHHISNSEIADHATKLNMLAEIACSDSVDPEDLLVFLDSDAFPIAPWEALVREKLKSNVLVAVRRDENLGDPQPHPCFCVTTTRFWRENNADWSKGYQWKNSAGKLVTDVGGNLLKTLRAGSMPWHPLLRSNAMDLHPLFFGVYGNLIYHHGAGSRKSSSRLDKQLAKQETSKSAQRLLRLVGLKNFYLNRRAKANTEISLKIMDQIHEGPDFYRQFLAI